MAKFRQIQTNFWSNPYIQEEMTAEDKYFYLYLMTNEFTTQIGIYRITKKQIAFDLGYSIESVQALLQRFETYHKLIKYDVENREIILLKWAENNLNAGGKPIQDLVKKEIAEVKNKEFLNLMYEACPENELKKFIKTLISFEEFEEKTNNINDIDEPYHEPLDEPYNDTGAINNKEEIINNNKEKINKKEIAPKGANSKKQKIEEKETITKKLLNHIDSLNLDEERKALWYEWIEYKKKRGQYKDTNSIDKLLKRFNKYDVDTLREIIDKSIMNNYAGIFELKNKPIEKPKITEVPKRVVKNNLSDFDF